MCLEMTTNGVTMKSSTEATKEIVDAIRRKKARFALGFDPSLTGMVVLFAGSYRALRSEDGIIVTMGVNRENLLKLREECDEALKYLDEQSS